MKLTKPSLKKPAMKKPDLKPPAVLADLYYDLRDRRLLLPIALVVVAIAAVPFLLGDSEPVAQPPVAVAPPPSATNGATASLAVVEATPGLRDYRKRLRNRTATNPFKQRYTSLPDGAQVESSSVSSTGGADGGSVEIGEVSEETVTSPGDDSGTGGAGSGESQRYELVINVQIRRIETKPDGSELRGELEVRKGVPVLAQLPSKKTPVVTTFGANVETQRLAFLVSRDVKSISGEFACLTRANDLCEVLEVRLGTLLEFVYEPNGARYEMKVTGVDVVPARNRNDTSSSRVAFGAAYPGMAWKTP
jgi:hypothetical protein